MHRGSRGEHGGIGAEHVAVIALIAVVVTAIWTLEVPRIVGEHGRYAVCLLFDGDASSCEAPGDQGPVLAGEDTDPPVCTVAGRERDQRNTTDLLLRRTIDGERFAVTELSDGSVVILDTDYEGSGDVVGGGFELPFGRSSKLDVNASGSAVTLDEAGIVYHLAGDTLEAYRDAQGERAANLYVYGPELAARELGYGATTPQEFADQHRAVDIITDTWDAQVEQHATHDIYRTSGEVTLDVGAAFKGVSGSVTVAGSTGSTVQVDRTTGSYDVTMDLSGELSHEIGVGLLGVGASGGGAEAVGSSLTLSFDADHELIGATANVTFEATATGFVGFDLGGIPGAPRGGEAGFGFDLERGALVETTFALPIDGPGSEAIVERLVRDPAGTAGAAFAHAVNGGSAIAQAFDVEEHRDNASLALRLVASIGVSDEDTSRQLRLVDAVSYDAHNGLMRRGDCLG